MKIAGNITIRQMKTSEIKKVIDLTNQAFDNPYVVNDFSLNHLMMYAELPRNIVRQTKEGAKILVAVKNGRIIGAVRYKLLPNKKIYLSELVISKNNRGKGIAKMLVENVESIGKENNAAKTTLECTKENLLPQFYKRLGFKVDKIEKRHDWHKVYMSKKVK